MDWQSALVAYAVSTLAWGAEFRSIMRDGGLMNHGLHRLWWIQAGWVGASILWPLTIGIAVLLHYKSQRGIFPNEFQARKENQND